MPDAKILHITGLTSAKYGGFEKYLLELARFCNEKKYHTVLQYESLPWSKEYSTDLAKLDIEILIQSTYKHPIKSLLGVIKMIGYIKPKIVHVHFPNKYVFLITPIVSRMFGVNKILYTKHGTPGLGKKSIQRFIYNQYNQILAVSESIAHNLIQAGVKSNNVSVHYLGLFGKREKSNQLRSQLRKEFKISNHSIVVGCIAFSNPLKGLDVLLKAFAKVIEKNSEAHLIIIGVDPRSLLLQKQSEELDLTNNVHWAGIRDDGWQILNAADIYVQPSRSEGLPLAIAEAMALGLPVVATEVGGVPEIVKNGENGYLAKPGCVNSLADALERMLKNRSQWAIMGKAGYQRYRDLFDGEKSVKSLVEQYYNL